MGKCIKPNNHANHICQLKIAQQFDMVKSLKVDAEFFCENCKAPSKISDHLCVPKKYLGTPGILKWKKH